MVQQELERRKESCQAQPDDDGFKFKDELLLLLLFPVEIWIKIIRSIESRSLQNVYHSSPFFESLIRPLKTEIYFPVILQHILPYLVPRDEYRSKWRRNKSVSLDYREGGKNLQICRHVCRKWANGVNAILEDVQSRVPWQLLERFQVSLGRDLERLTKFQNHFQYSHMERNQNPFIGRRLEISYRNAGGFFNNLVKLEAILQMCGQHVWHCYISASDLNAEQLYRNLQRILDFTPNLKSLHFCGNISMNMQTVLRVPPFSNLPKLQYLSVRGKDSSLALKLFLSNNRQVKVLSTHMDSNRNNSVLYTKPIPHLKELSISLKNNFEDFFYMDNLCFFWPLRKLTLNFNKICDPVSGEKLRRCFIILEEKFSNTLQELVLSMPRVSEDTWVTSLKLPRLTHLSLTLKCPVSLDFILPLQPSLKYLDIYISGARLQFSEPLKEDVIKFFEFAPHRLLHSNIWQTFPKMEKISYSVFMRGPCGSWIMKEKFNRPQTNIIMSDFCQ